MAGNQFYALGGNCSIFWDPQQPEVDNQTLQGDDVKQLEVTAKVVEWSKAGGLVKLSESEAKEKLARNKDRLAELEKETKASKILNKAGAKEQENALVLKEAQVKLDAAKQIEDSNKVLTDENTELKKRLQELELDKGKTGQK